MLKAYKRRGRAPILGLDLVRFAAALLVLGYHFGFMFWKENVPAGYIVELPPASSTELPSIWFGFVGVQIFFVISGFVIAYSAESTNGFSFFRDRVVRLGPGLWICATFSLFVYLAFNVAKPESAVADYLRQILFMPFGPWLDSAVWTLGIEISFYALVFALICCRQFRHIRLVAAGLACVSLGFQLFLLVMHCDGATRSDVCVVMAENMRLAELILLKHGGFFAVGILLWLWLIKQLPLRRLWWGGPALAACILQIVRNVGKEEHSGLHIGYRGDLSEPAVIAVWLAALIAIVISVRYNELILRLVGDYVARAVRLLGLSTYAVYLLHWTAAGVFAWVLLKLGMAFDLAIWLAAAGVIALSLLVAAVLEPLAQGNVRLLLDRAGLTIAARARVLSFLFREG